MICNICKKPAENHHFKTRGSGGTDDSWNLLPLCRDHHTEIHQLGNSRFIVKYPIVREWLKNNGWDFDPVLLKWTHKR